jgi:hypothetical protein
MLTASLLAGLAPRARRRIGGGRHPGGPGLRGVIAGAAAPTLPFHEVTVSATARA